MRARDQRLGGKLVGRCELEPLRLARYLLEAPRDDRDVVRVLVLEDPQLRVGVGLEAAVPVEVVRLEVEQHGDVRLELVDVLELEARDLADDDLVRVGRCRRARVSARPTFPATGAPSIAPSSSLVVVFPFVPVTATIVVASSRDPSSTSLQTGIPRVRAA